MFVLPRTPLHWNKCNIDLYEKTLVTLSFAIVSSMLISMLFLGSLYSDVFDDVFVCMHIVLLMTFCISIFVLLQL